MDDPEYVLKLEARFVAIEYMLAHLITAQYRADQTGPEEIAETHAVVRERARSWTFPELKDAAFSDALASEVELALGSLLAKVEALVARQNEK